MAKHAGALSRRHILQLLYVYKYKKIAHRIYTFNIVFYYIYYIIRIYPTSIKIPREPDAYHAMGA